MSRGGVRAFALARQTALATAAVRAAGKVLAIEVRTPMSVVPREGRA